MAPESVGPYRILQKLGSGGMGDVYLAEDPRLGRQVALKGLTERWARVPDARRRLVREARAAAGLNHTNVAAIYDVVETAEATWIVMEHAPGESLAEILRRGALTPEAVVWVGVQLCDALGAAHARNLVHRDLKPANLMLSADGHLKVLDFGLAKSLDLDSDSGEPAPEGAADLSDQGRLVGTLPYVPPEHIVGERVDERSDVYSAGVVLFELLAGRRPYDGPDKKALAQAIVDGHAPDLQALRPEANADLVRVVMRAMAREPSDRPPTAGALRSELEHLNGAQSGWETITDLQRPLGVRSKPSSSRRRQKRGRWRVGAAVAVGVLALAGLVAWLRFPSPPAPPPPRVPVVAVLPLLDASADLGNESLGLGLAEVLVASLSKLHHVNVLSRATAAGYRERGRNAVRIAHELGADYVVDGVLQRSADDLRVTLSLVQATTGLVVWSDVYDRPLREVFPLQRSAAEAVAGALSVRLTPDDLSRIRRGPTIAAGAFADYARGRDLFEQADAPGNLEQAIGLFERALAQDPAFALAKAGLGEAEWALYKRTHDPAFADRARAATRDALRLDPEQPLVRIALATIEAGTGHLEDAERELRRAIQQQPDNDEAHEALGTVLSSRGHPEEALRHLERAVELRPNYWRHVDALGVAHFDAGRYKEASEAFRRFATLKPESARAFHQLGTAQQAMGDAKGALVSYQKGLALEPDADTWSNVGVLLYTEGRFQDAATAFARAVAMQPDEPVAQRNLGDAQARLGRAEDAQAAYRRALELTLAQLRVNPSDAHNLGRLAVYHAKLKERDHAQAAAAKALGLAPNAPDVLFYAAVARALGGQAPEAIALLERALAAGYSLELVKADEDLTTLRTSPEYARLVAARGAKKQGGVK